MSVLNSWNCKEGKCACCGSEDIKHSPRLNVEEGFMSSSYNIEVCDGCYGKPTLIGETVFRKIGDGLFWEFNADYGIMNCLRPVKNYRHFEYLKNRRTEEFLDGVKFSDDRYEEF